MLVRLRQATQVYDLLEQGASTDEIASLLEISREEVRRIIVAQERSIRDDLAERVERHRNAQLGRLEDLLAAVWDRAIGDPESDDLLARAPSIPAITTALRIMKRQSALLGLDAPTKHAVAVDATVKHGLDLSRLSSDDLAALERTLVDSLANAGGPSLEPGALVVDVVPEPGPGGSTR
jgi:hypothetical protein